MPIQINKGIIGKESPPFVITVERGRIKEFARAIGDDNALFQDDRVGQASEWGDIIAPPTFLTTFRDGADSATFLRELGTDISRVLHGEQEFEIHRPIRPGETWTPEWTVDQPAATLWYHPHPHPDTEDQVYRGLVGMFILDDPEAAALALPHDYGVDDIPLLIQDKKFEDDGSLDFSKGLVSPTGLLGDEILVNGTHDPHLAVRHERVRLRLVNASGARVYNIGFADERPFELIATDGGLLPAPHKTRRIQLSPGERAEIVARFEPGEEVVLRSFEPDLGTNFFDGRFSGADDTFDLLEVRAARRLAAAPAVPRRLAAPEPAPPGPRGRVRRFELSGQGSINAQSLDMERIDEVVRAGTTETWEATNVSGQPHVFHPHDVRFRVLEYGGERPPPHLRGPKDTVYLRPHETVRLAIRFGDLTDPEHPYMFHCHVLQHEDRGMMGQFTVVE